MAGSGMRHSVVDVFRMDLFSKVPQVCLRRSLLAAAALTAAAPLPPQVFLLVDGVSHVDGDVLATFMVRCCSV